MKKVIGGVMMLGAALIAVPAQAQEKEPPSTLLLVLTGIGGATAAMIALLTGNEDQDAPDSN